jgi:hypothetical protein
MANKQAPASNREGDVVYNLFTLHTAISNDIVFFIICLPICLLFGTHKDENCLLLLLLNATASQYYILLTAC